MNKIMGILLFAFSLLLSQTSFADKEYCHGKLKNMIESFNLTEEQKTKIKPILEQLKTTLKENGMKMHDLGTQMKQHITTTPIDESAMNNMVDQKTALIGNMMKAKIRAKNQIYAILNPEQKTKFMDKMREKEQKMAEKFKNCRDDD